MKFSVDSYGSSTIYNMKRQEGLHRKKMIKTPKFLTENPNKLELSHLHNEERGKWGKGRFR